MRNELNINQFRVLVVTQNVHRSTSSSMYEQLVFQSFVLENKLIDLDLEDLPFLLKSPQIFHIDDRLIRVCVLNLQIHFGVLVYNLLVTHSYFVQLRSQLPFLLLQLLVPPHESIDLLHHRVLLFSRKVRQPRGLRCFHLRHLEEFPLRFLLFLKQLHFQGMHLSILLLSIEVLFSSPLVTEPLLDKFLLVLQPYDLLPLCEQQLAILPPDFIIYLQKLHHIDLHISEHPEQLPAISLKLGDDIHLYLATPHSHSLEQLAYLFSDQFQRPCHLFLLLFELEVLVPYVLKLFVDENVLFILRKDDCVQVLHVFPNQIQALFIEKNLFLPLLEFLLNRAVLLCFLSKLEEFLLKLPFVCVYIQEGRLKSHLLPPLLFQSQGQRRSGANSQRNVIHNDQVILQKVNFKVYLYSQYMR